MAFQCLRDVPILRLFVKLRGNGSLDGVLAVVIFPFPDLLLAPIDQVTIERFIDVTIEFVSIAACLSFPGSGLPGIMLTANLAAYVIRGRLHSLDQDIFVIKRRPFARGVVRRIPDRETELGYNRVIRRELGRVSANVWQVNRWLFVNPLACRDVHPTLEALVQP